MFRRRSRRAPGSGSTDPSARKRRGTAQGADVDRLLRHKPFQSCALWHSQGGEGSERRETADGWLSSRGVRGSCHLRAREHGWAAAFAATRIQRGTGLLFKQAGTVARRQHRLAEAAPSAPVRAALAPARSARRRRAPSYRAAVFHPPFTSLVLGTKLMSQLVPQHPSLRVIDSTSAENDP